MGKNSSLFKIWVSNKIVNKYVKNKNTKRKNIIRYKADLRSFISRDSQVGSYVVSGHNEVQRNMIAGAIATCSLNQGTPVIILHENNIQHI